VTVPFSSVSRLPLPTVAWSCCYVHFSSCIILLYCTNICCLAGMEISHASPITFYFWSNDNREEEILLLDRGNIIYLWLPTNINADTVQARIQMVKASCDIFNTLSPLRHDKCRAKYSLYLQLLTYIPDRHHQKLGMQCNT
jgi:hypothetical protein